MDAWNALLTMAPELGQVALLLALAAALVQGTVPLAGAARGDALWMSLGRSAALAQALAVLLALALLTASFVGHDFSVLYVASNSNRSLPLAYRLAGVWGGHEGSLLLWVAMLSLWTVAVVLKSAHLPPALTARILAVMGLVSVGFLLFMLTTSNPFERLIPAPPDGRDLNPLLQDPGMVFHPPMLYMGYVGFSVAFAFAVAALIGGELDARWARWTRPWTTAAWCFLTVGIALGSAWAYYELGWGGWWFWDPVENASFMPWLLGTALIHSLAVTEKRGAFKSWTVLLAILAFSLSLLGTFLVRSGVLSSVHAFATDPRRGLFILGFLVVVTGSSLLLYAWRAPRIGLGARFGALSRESMLLANNVVLAAATGTVLLGTLYPLLLDALDLGKLSVGPPYFETVFVPLMTVLLLLAGVGPLVRWRGDSLRAVAGALRRPVLLMALASLAGAVGLSALAGGVRPGPVLGLFLALWVLGGVVADLRPWVAARRGVPRATLGMALAHLGVAAFAVGVTMVRSYEIESDQRLAPGQSVVLQDLSFRFLGVRDLTGPNYEGLRAEVEVWDGSRRVAVLHPEKRVYRVQRNTMTEAAIQPGLTRDLYVALGEEVAPDVWTLRLYIKPFVDWIWGGCLLMALGGALAASDRRYRSSVRQAETPAAGSGPAADAGDASAPNGPNGPQGPNPPLVLLGSWGAAAVVLVGALAMGSTGPAQAQGAAAPVAARPADPAEAESPEIEARMRAITAELRCLVCQNQTIADSHAGLALDLKREVRAMLRQGASDQAVRDYMTQRYGDFVLYRPPLQPTTWLLWAGPALLLGAGTAALVLSLRRRARLSADRFEAEPDADADDAPPPHGASAGAST